MVQFVLFLIHFFQMPTFRDGKVIVNESSAICMYLEVRIWGCCPEPSYEVH